MKLVDKFWPFLKADYKSIEQYLEEQARKGLHIKVVDAYGVRATYEKAEPRNVKYCLDYFSGNEDEAGEYLTMLEDAGWNFAGKIDQNLVFVSDNGKKPTPIHTDAEEEYRRIRKGLWMFDLPIGIATLILCYFICTTEVDITSVKQIFFLLCFVSMAGFGLVGLYRSLLFLFRSKVAITKGQPLKASNYKVAKFWGQLHAAFGVGMGIGWIARLIMSLETIDGNPITARVLLFGGLFAWIIVMLGMNPISNHLPDKAGKIIMAVIEIIGVCCFLGYCCMI